MKPRRALVVLLMAVWAGAASSEDADALAQRAWQAYSAGEFTRAAELFERALALEARQELAYAAARSAARAGQSDRALALLERVLQLGEKEAPPAHMVGDSDLDSIRNDPRFGRLLERARAVGRHARKRVGAGLSSTTVAAAGLDRAALERLLVDAEGNRTSALVILVDGKLAGEWYFGGWSERIEAMSATKSVVALAVGILVQDGKLTLDTPLHTLYPELAQGLKRGLTVRHLLNHTSGIAADRITTEIYAAPDFVQLALAADLDAPPGERFFYNNKAVNLLAGLVARASGSKLDGFLRERLFAPLGISDVTWTRDRAGNPHAMSGLQIHPLDLAKIGQLVLDEGVWRGQRLLSTEFIRSATRSPGQPFEPTIGLLWWLSYSQERRVVPVGWATTAQEKGLDPALAAKLRPLEGHRYTGTELWAALGEAAPVDSERAALRGRLEELGVFPPVTVEGPVLASSAQGYAGQYLYVVPRCRLVLVRMSTVWNEPDENQAFRTLGARVLELCNPKPR